MGSKAGVLKVVAARLGMTVSEYQHLRDSGKKRCVKCKAWVPCDHFVVDRSRSDGLGTKCKACRLSPTPWASLRGRVSTFNGRSHTEAAKLKMHLAHVGKPNPHRVGAKHTPETLAKISAITKARTPRGSDHYAFSHGKAQRHLCDRRTAEYKAWRLAVFTRDKFTCQKCGDAKGGNLRAHHKKPFATHPELRFVVDNGTTLCHPCHELEHYKPDSIRNQRRVKRGHKLF